MNNSKILLTVVTAWSSWAIAAVDPNALDKLMESSKQLRHEIMQSNAAVLAQDPNNPARKAVAEMIAKLDASKAKKLRDIRKPVAAKPVLVEVAPDPNKGAAPAEKPTFTPEVLANIMALAKDPNSITEPLALAQTLFESGHGREAISFYRIASSRNTSFGQELTADDKAWILLQLSTCQKPDDPRAALATLKQLISTYPSSTWTLAAIAHRDLLEWYLKDNPTRLIEAGKQ